MDDIDNKSDKLDEEIEQIDQNEEIEQSGPEGEKRSYIVKLRGLPWSASFKDIEEFFDGCKIKNGARGCLFNNAKDGRPSGEAYVEFETEEDFEGALEKDKKYMDSRYVEVFEAERDDFNHYKRKYGDEQDNLVRLRGLPYKCTIEEIETFFTGLDVAPNGITLPKDEEGKCSEAFVQFKDYESLEAGLKKHKGKMGHRYIEVFMSSLKELDYVLTSAKIRPLMSLKPDPYSQRSNMQSKQTQNNQQKMMKMIASSNMSHMEKKQMISMMNNLNSSSTRFPMSGMNMMMPINNMMNQMQPKRNNWVKLRGLPFIADEEDIIRFFKPYKPTNVTIELDHKGRASGEAFAEFPTDEIALEVVDEKNRKNIGHRYIELFLEMPNDEPRDRMMPQMLNAMMGGGGGIGQNQFMHGNNGPIRPNFKNDINKFKRNRRDSFENSGMGMNDDEDEGHYKRRTPYQGSYPQRPIPRYGGGGAGGRPMLNRPFKMNLNYPTSHDNNGSMDGGMRFFGQMGEGGNGPMGQTNYSNNAFKEDFSPGPSINIPSMGNGGGGIGGQQGFNFGLNCNNGSNGSFPGMMGGGGGSGIGVGKNPLHNSNNLQQGSHQQNVTYPGGYSGYDGSTMGGGNIGNKNNFYAPEPDYQGLNGSIPPSNNMGLGTNDGQQQSFGGGGGGGNVTYYPNVNLSAMGGGGGGFGSGGGSNVQRGGGYTF